MSDESKNSAGLFRLQDLDDIKVEKESIFPKPADKRDKPPPIPESGSSMVDVIRQARASQPEPVDERNEPSLLATREPTPSEEEPSSNSEENRFDTAEHLAMAEAMAVDQRRSRRGKILALSVFMVVLIGGLAAALALVLQPSPIMEDRFPTYSPTVLSHTSDLDPVDIALIPVVVPEETATQEDEPRSRENRRRNRDQSSRVNRGDLF